MDANYEKIINEVSENSNVQIITKNKKDRPSLVYCELIQDHKEQSNLRKMNLSKKIN